MNFLTHKKLRLLVKTKRYLKSFDIRSHNHGSRLVRSNVIKQIKITSSDTGVNNEHFKTQKKIKTKRYLESVEISNLSKICYRFGLAGNGKKQIFKFTFQNYSR